MKITISIEKDDGEKIESTFDGVAEHSFRFCETLTEYDDKVREFHLDFSQFVYTKCYPCTNHYTKRTYNTDLLYVGNEK